MPENYTHDSIRQHNLSSKLSFDMACMKTGHGTIIYTIYFLTSSLLLLPSCILIIKLGLQQWWRQRTTSSAPAAQSPVQVFNNSYAAMALLTILAQITCCCGIYTDDVVLQFGYYLWCFAWFGEFFFHVLACLERYMAVVHPVAFLRLRGKRGLRIKNIALYCVWLLSFGGTPLVGLEDAFPHIILFLVLGIFVVLTFFSLSVLCILLRPGPGQQGGKREKVDQSKQMAFYTIIVILGSESLKIFNNILWCVFSSSSHQAKCSVIMSALWLSIPSAHALPFLILQKAGAFTCCKRSAK